MDLTTIEYAIEELENGEETFDNITELACLYIIRDNLSRSSPNISRPEKELNDILPYYQQYIKIKREYQQNKISESAVIAGIKDVCRELTEFIDTLYSCTDMGKERRCIVQMLDSLAKKYQK